MTALTLSPPVPKVIRVGPVGVAGVRPPAVVEPPILARVVFTTPRYPTAKPRPFSVFELPFLISPIWPACVPAVTLTGSDDVLSTKAASWFTCTPSSMSASQVFVIVITDTLPARALAFCASVRAAAPSRALPGTFFLETPEILSQILSARPGFSLALVAAFTTFMPYIRISGCAALFTLLPKAPRSLAACQPDATV